MFGWNNKWEFVERISEGEYSKFIYDIYRDKNKNWLFRYKKILVNYSNSIYNTSGKLLNKKEAIN